MSLESEAIGVLLDLIPQALGHAFYECLDLGKHLLIVGNLNIAADSQDGLQVVAHHIAATPEIGSKDDLREIVPFHQSDRLQLEGVLNLEAQLN